MSETPPKSARVTIYDVANEAGVSKSLVSLYLHNDPRVSDERKALITAAIAKLDYRPSRAAKALAGKSSHTIGVLVEDYSNLWFIRLVAGLRSVLDDAGYQLTVSDMHEVPAGQDDPVDAFLAMHVDGLIIAVDPAELHQQHIQVPCVVIGERLTLLPNADIVTNDDFNGAAEVVNELVKLGHTKIGHITSAGGPALHRLNGYLDAMAKHGLKGTVVGRGAKPNEQSGFELAPQVLAKESGLTAIFTANDSMAGGVLAYLKESEISVPAQISVVGFDNSPLSSRHLLNLSSVEFAGEDIGQEAAKELLRRIADPDKPVGKTVLPCTVILRGSTKAI